MARISAAGMGNGRGSDAYHNQFLDTGSMLAASLKKTMGNSNVQVDPEMPDEGMPHGDPAAIQYGQNESLIAPNSVLQSHVVANLDNLKEDLISLFQESSSDPVRANRAEAMIRRVENIQESMGVLEESFDPLRNMSGLAASEPLENAERVIENTLRHYRLYGISAISSEMSNIGPAIKLSIFGNEEDTGFEIEALIAAKNDFGGNEAIDYVWSKDGGLMTIKARSQGRWVDVSENFAIDVRAKRFTLGNIESSLHSLFLGEKIISEGKEKIVKALKVNTDDLKFGKCRVFSEDASLMSKIVALVQVNSK